MKHIASKTYNIYCEDFVINITQKLLMHINLKKTPFIMIVKNWHPWFLKFIDLRNNEYFNININKINTSLIINAHYNISGIIKINVH